LNILEENKNTCKKMMEVFKQMYETYRKLESELKNLTQRGGVSGVYNIQLSLNRRKFWQTTPTYTSKRMGGLCWP